MSLKLKEIYDQDINRVINPAVVVSNKNADTIKAEIREYVFTDDLMEKLYKLLDTVINNRKKKTGIWINGYYGSGKSHFIKYVHYCLTPETQEEAFSHFVKASEKYDGARSGANMDITPSNISLLKKKIHATKFDNIMFNVEDETDDGSGERLTRLFLHMFNKFRGYNSQDIPLAILLEKYLDGKGKYQEFINLVSSELGHDWKENSAEIASYELDGVLEVAKSLVPEMDTVSLHSKLSNPDTIKISITDTLIPELNNYLVTKDKNYRLIFLVDEISQYIGRNKDILLNFQSIIERISEDCNNQVWIACTAQQTLNEVSFGVEGEGSENVEDEFGKILGRFDTRISLQSNDASYITQKRVLDKNSKGLEALSTIYSKNKDYILNQFKISHELYKGYQGEDDFSLAYPFVPYQFKLIAHIFEAFQQLSFVIKEVKDNERSVLGITHFTAKATSENEVGGFIPFDAFYNNQFHTNLTHRGSKAISNGLELSYVQKNEFAQRVVKCLFMISNLMESQRQTFPSTIDNMTVLLMDKLDQNKMQLQKQIKEVLDKLIEESIIREEKGSFFFFNEDEIDVQNYIKNQSLTVDDRLERFDEFFRRLSGLRNKFTFGQNDFKVGYSVEGKEFLRNGDFNILVLYNDKTAIQNKALELPKTDMAICINEWFTKDEQLRSNFEWYCKTRKFFSNNENVLTGERAKTIENFRIRNNELEKRIRQKLEQRFSETQFISEQRVISADQINGTSPADRTKNAINKHLSGIYRNHHLAEGYARNQAELKAEAASKQILLPNLNPAEEIVNDLITSYNNEMTAQDLINEFAKAPFGWRHEAVLNILVNLVKKKKREFKYRNTPRFGIVDFINKAVSTSERSVCQICSGEEIDQTTIDATLIAFREVFNRDLPATTDSNELFDMLIDEIAKEKAIYQPLEDTYAGNYHFGESFHKTVKLLNSWSAKRDPKSLFAAFKEDKDDAKKLLDDAKGIADFAHKNEKDYNAIRKFHGNNTENFLQLSPVDQEKAEKIGSFLKLTDPRREYRHIRKAYDEVKKALNDLRKNLTTEVVKLYEAAFDDLEKEAKNKGVHEANVYADRERIIANIKSIDAIAQLSNKKLDVNNFKAEQIKAIIEYAAKSSATTSSGSTVGEPEVYYVSNVITTISNEEELEVFLSKVKKEMSDILKKDKTIIIK